MAIPQKTVPQIGETPRAIGDLASRPLDYTQLACIERCPQEFVYRYVQHLASARPDPSAWFGQAVHLGVRKLYEIGDTSAEAIGAAHAAMATLAAPPIGEKKPYLTLEYAQAVVATYATVYPREKWDFDILANETYLAQGPYCGIVDRVVRWKGDGCAYLHDLKTTGLFVNAAWLAQFAHSQQMAGYLDLAEAHFGEPLVGVWIDAIHVDRRGKPKPEDFLRHGPLAYPEALRIELREQRTVAISEAQLVRATPARARKHTTQCFRFSAPCSFLRFCRTEPQDRADLVQLAQLTGELATHDWNPEEVSHGK